MALDAEFLGNIFANETDSVDSKIQQIVTEYNADINGLKTKNAELIGNEKKLKESIRGYESGKADFEQKILDLTRQIESKSDDKTKEYYEQLMKTKSDEFGKERESLKAQISDLNKYRLNDIKNKAVAKGIDGIKFTNDTMKNAFLALVMAQENFEATDIDGETIFLNRDKKNMTDVIKEMALSEMGRQFIANGISGGGGVPNANKSTGGVTENPFKTGDLEMQTKLYKENKPLAVRLAKEAGVNLD